jgi:RND family efflux transporter MFP subunit
MSPLLSLGGLLALLSLSAFATPPSAKPSLSVTLVKPEMAVLSQRIAATGGIAAWQEASIGGEAQGLRLAEVRVNVGDAVKKGQVLALFAAEPVQAELAQARAQVAEAEAALKEAQADTRRTAKLRAEGFVSEEKLTQSLTAETTAQARLEAYQAGLRARAIRLEQTRVLAPDDGVISARAATVGAVPGAGQELFRLIRQGRLEWRAETPSADLGRIRPGQRALLTLPGGETLQGTARKVAPTVDPQTRNGLVYVDLPRSGPALAGMFARGEFLAGESRALTLPQSAVLLREGFSYVFKAAPGRDGLARVILTKVRTGRRAGELVEITGGLEAEAQVVAKGGAFLAEGDLVRVVADAARPTR